MRGAEQDAEQTQQRLHQLDARLTALQSLQEQVSRGGEIEPWLERHELRRNPHLWQGMQRSGKAGKMRSKRSCASA